MFKYHIILPSLNTKNINYNMLYTLYVLSPTKHRMNVGGKDALDDS